MLSTQSPPRLQSWYAPLITADADRQVALALSHQHSSFLVGGFGGVVRKCVTTLKGRHCVVCIWYVCVWGGGQLALPAQGSAAKTIICDRSARDDSLPRDSLTLSDDQNRKKLTGRRVKVSERGTKTESERGWWHSWEEEKIKQSEALRERLEMRERGALSSLNLTAANKTFWQHRPASLSVTEDEFVSQVTTPLAVGQKSVTDVITCWNTRSWNMQNPLQHLNWLCLRLQEDQGFFF